MILRFIFLSTNALTVKSLDKVVYQSTWDAMLEFTECRVATTPDEIWLLEHPPVFTQGLAGKKEHLLAPGDIPVIQTDRGGQVTYHGPGQLVCYFLLDLKRLGIGPKSLVHSIEHAVIALLSEYDIHAATQKGAPGIYVDGSKIGSIGLRIKKGCSYHGLSLNVDMDLSPFNRINPCGFAKLPMTQMANHAANVSFDNVKNQLVKHIKTVFGYGHPD